MGEVGGVTTPEVLLGGSLCSSLTKHLVGGDYLGPPGPVSPQQCCVSPERAVVLLYVLLALAFVVFTALTVVSLQRVSSVWEALGQARTQSQDSHLSAWHNFSDVQRTLDQQLSGRLKVLQSQLLNVSREVQNVQRKVTQSKAEVRKELLDRLHVLEGRDPVGPVLQQVEKLKQEQNRVSGLLDTALEKTRSLSETLCLKCPSGWEQFSKTCYFFSSSLKSWEAAKEFCAGFNALLAVVSSEQENKFLSNHILNNREFWLGLSDTDQEGSWKWVTGHSLSLSLWNTGEPNNSGQHGEDCATIYSSGLWNDVPCSSSKFWICERSC